MGTGLHGHVYPTGSPPWNSSCIEPARNMARRPLRCSGAAISERLSMANGDVTQVCCISRRRIIAAFYNSQKFTLNITRAAMVQAGYSPSVRLFEAAACGTPIISDAWPGLETIFGPRPEILIARSTEEVSPFCAISRTRNASASPNVPANAFWPSTLLLIGPSHLESYASGTAFQAGRCCLIMKLSIFGLAMSFVLGKRACDPLARPRQGFDSARS